MSGDVLSVVAAVQSDLRLLASRRPELAGGALAAAALNLAGRIDDPGTSAHAAAVAAKELRETMGRLEALCPADERKDSLDELNARRVARSATA